MTRERRDNTSTMSEELLKLAIDYVVSSQYPPGLDKAKKRAIRRRVATLTVENGEFRRVEGTEGQSNHYCSEH